MKKIYSLALAALVAASAYATSFEVKQLNPVKPVRQASVSGIRMEKIAAPAASVRTMAAPMADDTEGIAGEYTITINDVYFNTSTGEFNDVATITDNGDGTITISCDYFMSDVKAEYDAATGTITFNADKDRFEYEINGQPYYTCCSPTAWDAAAKDAVIASYSVTYSNSAIEFPADHGFGWPAYTSPRTDEIAGWIDIFDVLSIFVDHSITYEDAQWTGNILAGAFPGTSAVTEPSTVTVKYNPDTKIYTIFDAFGATYSQLGADVQSPAITIEAADPDNCVLPLTSTGINGGETDGLYGVFSFSYLKPDETPEDIQIKLTEDDKTVTITLPVESVYLYAATAKKVVAAVNSTESKLVINKKDAGVDGIESDNLNAPVEYFNLQGVKVANPANGLYIVRQGNKVTKQVIR